MKKPVEPPQPTGMVEPALYGDMPAPVHVGKGYLIRATESRFSVERGLPAAMGAFRGATDPDVLKQIFAGAIYVANLHARRTPPVPGAPQPVGGLSLMAYVWSLARSYLTTHATPPTMIAVAERFAQAGKSDLAERCHTMAREESGHDTLVLRDLAALGYSAEPLVVAIHPQIGVALVDLFQRYAKSDHPIGCFGYAYALERQALFCDASVIAAVENVIPAGIHATRCLRVHSAVGADLNHVYESLEFMATMSATEQVRIASAVFETTSVMNDPALLDFPGDEVVAARIAAFSTELPSISAA